MSLSFAFVLPALSRRCPASLSLGWKMTMSPPRPPPAMSSPMGDVMATPFIGADDDNNSTAVPPQVSAFFQDIKGDYYDGLQKWDSKDCIALGSAVFTDGEARALSDWEE